MLMPVYTNSSVLQCLDEGVVIVQPEQSSGYYRHIGQKFHPGLARKDYGL